MEPKKGAIEAVHKLKEHYNVYILTTAPWKNPSAWADKVEWVTRYLNDVFHKRIVMTHCKGLLSHGDGAEYQWDKISKNGVLVDYEPWCMNIHCDGEYFKELLSYIDYIALQGFEVSHNEAECSLDWKYDRISETEKCNSVLQHISKQLPQVELICYRNEWKDGVPEISEYCIMMNGDGEWKEADDTMIDLAEKCVYGILEDKTTIFDIIKDARTCGH